MILKSLEYLNKGLIMNKITALYYKIRTTLSNARIRFFVRMAGFCNVDMMKIICINKNDKTTLTMDKDGSIHRIISLKTKITSRNH